PVTHSECTRVSTGAPVLRSPRVSTRCSAPSAGIIWPADGSKGPGRSRTASARNEPCTVGRSTASVISSGLSWGSGPDDSEGDVVPAGAAVAAGPMSPWWGRSSGARRRSAICSGGILATSCRSATVPRRGGGVGAGVLVVGPVLGQGAAVGDLLDGDHGQVVPVGEGAQGGGTHHGAVVVDQLDECPCSGLAGQGHQVHAGLGVTSSLEHS